MKTYKQQKLSLLATLATFATFALATPLSAHGDHDHDHDHDHAEHDHAKKAGPNGGLILTEIEPHAELFITKDRLVMITILDETGKMVPVGKQEFKIVGGARSAPTTMEFTPKDKVLISSQKLPEGMNVPIIISYRATPEGKTKTIRLALNLAECSSCDSLEYACTCDHAH